MSANRVIVGKYPQAGVCVNVAIGIIRPIESSILTNVVKAALNAFEATAKLVTTQGSTITLNESVCVVAEGYESSLAVTVIE